MIHNSYSHIRFQKDCKALELNYYKKFMDLKALCPLGTEGAPLRRRLCKRVVNKKVLKMDRPLAGGFFGLTALRAEG